MCTSTHRLVCVAFHQSDGFQMVGEDAASTQMHVEPLDVGFGILNHPVVGSFHSRVDVALLLRELARDRRDACIVRTVILLALGTSVAQHQTTSLHRGVAGETMLNLSVHGEDGLEGITVAETHGNAFDDTSDVLFRHAWCTEFHGGGVHLVADVGSTFQFLNLLGFLYGTHVHDGLDELHRCLLLRLQGMDAHEVGQLNHQVMTALGHEVNRLSLGFSGIEHRLQFLHGRRLCNTHFFSKFLHRWYIAIPDDVVNVDVISEDVFLIVVNVNHPD